MLDKERGLYVAHSANGPISILGKMANRHGLIACATGTGKTVTLQVLAETFCQAGVPCFIADFLHLDQGPMRKRLYIAVPLFVLSGLLLWYNIADANGFNVIWRYFGWANQTLSVFMFWTATVYLVRNKPGLYYLIALLPALFMTSVCTTFILVDKIGVGLPVSTIPWIALGTFAISAILFYLWKYRKNK